VVQSKRPEILGIDPGDETKLHSPAQHLVDDGNLFGEAKRMIERDDVAHRADADAPCARAGTHGIEAGRGHPALVGAEMMLDTERMVEAQLVAQFKLIPELLIALMRRHSGLAPDVREVRELHLNIPIACFGSSSAVASVITANKAATR